MTRHRYGSPGGKQAKLRALDDLARSWPGVLEHRVCVVTIGRESWPAVMYKQEIDTPPGSNAFHAGERSYVRQGIYCLGKLPAEYEHTGYREAGGLRGHAIAFPYEGQDWYVAGYAQDIKKEFKAHHKLGKNFLLMPWTHSEPIDHYYKMDRGKEYKRVPMHVEFESV